MNSLRLAVIGLVTAALVAAGAQSAQAASKYVVTLTLSTTTADINSSVTLSGKVSPKGKLKGKKVTIDRKYGTTGSWKKATTAKLTSTGKFTKKVKLTKGGPTFFRVRKTAGNSHPAGVSAPRNISVLRWRWLNDLPFASTPANTYRGTVDINGHGFSAKSFSLHDSERVDWNLTGKQCTKLRGYIGIDDDSVNGTTGFAFITNQGFGILTYEQQLAKGQSARWINAKLTGPLLRFLPSVSDPDSWASYAEMQVYCNS